MNWRKLAIACLATLYFFMLLGAIGSHLILQRAPLDGLGSASFLFIAGSLVLLLADRKTCLRLFTFGILGYFAEVIGVRYAWLFGQYNYTEVLAPNLLSVPLVMVCAWFILLGYVKELVEILSVSGWRKVVLGGAWMTAIDVLLDPIAAHPFGFWTWRESGIYYDIPFRNFVGWFVVSCVILATDALIFHAPWKTTKNARLVGLGILALYTFAAFAYGYLLAGAAGTLLLGLHGSVSILAKSASLSASHKTRVAEITN